MAERCVVGTFTHILFSSKGKIPSVYILYLLQREHLKLHIDLILRKTVYEKGISIQDKFDGYNHT